MLPFKLIYHERYDLNLGAHVFPSQKYRLIEKSSFPTKSLIVEIFYDPNPPAIPTCCVTHLGLDRQTEDRDLTLSDVMKLEVPYWAELVSAFWLSAGGTILAAQSALQEGIGCNLGGGFHSRSRQPWRRL